MLFHITTAEAWAAARDAGAYRAASLDVEGFIHCSTRAQLGPVAAAFYAGQEGLIVLVVDPARLAARVVWEDPIAPPDAPAPATRGPFPHVYGAIGLDAVTAVVPLAELCPGP
jgi:uncharacterized protein (DUF952 family)